MFNTAEFMYILALDAVSDSPVLVYAQLGVWCADIFLYDEQWDYPEHQQVIFYDRQMAEIYAYNVILNINLEHFQYV